MNKTMKISLKEYQDEHAKYILNLDCSPKEYQRNHKKYKKSVTSMIEEINDSIEKGDLYYTLFMNKTIIGFAIIRPDNRFDAPNKTAYIEYYIDKKYKNEGIGEELIGLIIKKAKKKRFRKLMAIVYIFNYPSRKILLRNDFRQVGELINHMKHNDSNKYDSVMLYEYLL